MYVMEKSRNAGFVASFSFPDLFGFRCVCVCVCVCVFLYMNASNCEMFKSGTVYGYFPLTRYYTIP